MTVNSYCKKINWDKWDHGSLNGQWPIKESDYLVANTITIRYLLRFVKFNLQFKINNLEDIAAQYPPHSSFE